MKANGISFEHQRFVVGVKLVERREDGDASGRQGKTAMSVMIEWVSEKVLCGDSSC